MPVTGFSRFVTGTRQKYNPWPNDPGRPDKTQPNRDTAYHGRIQSGLVAHGQPGGRVAGGHAGVATNQPFFAALYLWTMDSTPYGLAIVWMVLPAIAGLDLPAFPRSGK